MSAGFLSTLLASPWQRCAAALALLSLLGCIWGIGWDSDAFFQAYLPVYLFWLGITLGAQPVLMIHSLTGGRWGRAIAPTLQGLLRFYPLLAVLFIPLLLRLDIIFPWAREQWSSAGIHYQPGYLNSAFLIARTLLYHAVWLYFAWALRARVRVRDACIGLPLYILTLSFFAIDWIVALEPGWYSTMFGFVLLMDHLVGAFAAAMIVALTLPAQNDDELLRQTRVQQDLGNLLLSGVIVWFYVSFMQYLIIWIADLPSEISWYRHRNHGGWDVLITVVVILHFALPTILLLARALKRSRGTLLAVAAMVEVARWLHLHWLVSPSFYPEALHFSLWQLPAGVAIFSLLWLSFHRFRPRLQAAE